MSSKGRWKLNARKWFGSIVNKHEKKVQMENSIIQLPTTPSKPTRPNPRPSIVPRILTAKSKTKVLPNSSTNNNHNHSINPVASYTQFHFPTPNIQREKPSLLTSSSTTLLYNRRHTQIVTNTEPTIRKTDQLKKEHSIDVTQWNTEISVFDVSKTFVTHYDDSFHKNVSDKQSNISEQCLINYAQISSKNTLDKHPSIIQSDSLSSINDNDEHNESSSSGIYTDERTDVTDRPRTFSKDTLSIAEALSIESIADSQISLNHCQSPPLITRYRLPILTNETVNNKSSQLQQQQCMNRFQRVYSAENLLKDNQLPTPIVTKARQSSAAIVKKIEKRIPTTRLSTNTLEKVGFVRITNATYRLTNNNDNHLYHRQRENSIIEYSDNEEPLPPANDEESYATLPRTSSTEQLDNNVENDLRAIVDDYLRPMVNSIKKTNSRLSKTNQRLKRSQQTNTNNTNNTSINNEQTQKINIDDLTEKLLSSVNCSTYAQYQRCY